MCGYHRGAQADESLSQTSNHFQAMSFKYRLCKILWDFKSILFCSSYQTPEHVSNSLGICHKPKAGPSQWTHVALGGRGVIAVSPAGLLHLTPPP